MKMIGARALIECLKKEQVQVVFGYPGGSVLTLYNELDQSDITHVLTGHEQGAVHAADGYARATGHTGVAFATSGPGVCNMVTGIATAAMDSIPLVVISGQVATTLIGRDSFQEADISGITTPITKHNYLVKNVKELPRVIKEAFYIASTGRPGPVLVDIAKDVFDAELDFSYPDSVRLRGYKGSIKGDEKDIDEAVEALKEARKPLILTGGGLILSETASLLRTLVKSLGVPVVTTLMGKGAIPDSWDLQLGLAGMHGSYASNMGITDCDLLLSFGARFDDRVTGDVENFAPNAKIVHFDIDKVEINKIVHADISVNGDLRWSLMWAAQFFPLAAPRRFITSGGLGTMGYGLPAALGAKVGCPKCKVVLFTGDGSILMNCQEFSTLHRYAVEVKVIVLQNGVLGMVNQWQRLFYGGRQAASVINDFPDMAKVARAMDVPSFTAASPDDLKQGLDQLFETPGPALLKVIIPSEQKVYPMVPGGRRLDEMILTDPEWKEGAPQ